MPASARPAPAVGLQTSADAVRLLEPHCVPPFFSRESYADLLELAATLPADLSLSHMYERPLGVPTAPVDFLLWIPDGGQREALAGGLPESFLTQESWRRISRFARSWKEEGSPTHGVRSVWLEFDIRGRLRGTPTPLIFITLERDMPLGPALELLQGRPPTLPQLGAFHRCWEAIPSSTRYRTVGLLYSRPTEALRLILIMAQDEAFRYLERIGWPGSTASLSRRVKDFMRFHPEVALHVDVHPAGVEPQVGMEIYVDERALYRGRGGDCRPLLDVAVEQSLCSPALRDALAAWPGSETRTLQGGLTVQVERMFHHLKVVSKPDLALQAKAYTTAEYEVLHT